MAHAVEPAHHTEVEHTTTGLNHRKLMMWVFLGSDCMFFGTLIATYMVYRGQSLNGPYPIDIINVPITTISTFVLLCSSFSMVQALSATNANDQRGIRLWLLATAFLGAIFIRVPGSRVQSVQERRVDVGYQPIRSQFLYPDRFPRCPRDFGHHLVAGHVYPGP